MPDHLPETAVAAEYARLSKDELLKLRRVFLANVDAWPVSRDRLRVIERLLALTPDVPAGLK